MRNSLVLLGVTQLWHVAQWFSRAQPHHTLPAFPNLNGTISGGRKGPDIRLFLTFPVKVPFLREKYLIISYFSFLINGTVILENWSYKWLKDWWRSDLHFSINFAKIWKIKIWKPRATFFVVATNQSQIFTKRTFAHSWHFLPHPVA